MTIPKAMKDPEFLENYRSIALLLSLSEIYEQITLNKFQPHIPNKIHKSSFIFTTNTWII